MTRDNEMEIFRGIFIFCFKPTLQKLAHRSKMSFVITIVLSLKAWHPVSINSLSGAMTCKRTPSDLQDACSMTAMILKTSDISL